MVKKAGKTEEISEYDNFIYTINQKIKRRIRCE